MIKILTDSVASIPADVAREAGIDVVTLFVNREGTEYADADMDLDAFYADIYDMVDDIPTSSQPSQLVLESLFEEAARAGDEVLGIFISSELSGTYEGAVRAARAVKARNIDFTYVIVDSTSCGYDEAWPVFDAVAARDAGEDLAGCAAAALQGIASTRFLFTPETLTFLQRGGRIGNAAALLGNLIQLSPVLTVSDGKATTFAKVRTRKKALDKIVATFKSDIEQHGLKHVVVHYIGDKTPAIEWAREVVEPLIGRSVSVLPVSPVIGLHVGPAVGIAYECANALAGKLSGPAQARACAS
ncbi:DegV family protein [Eggerthella guodeyinii]|uniref:DegV family protein n=2 Tax=Eggerthella TaxID=84111 RepID=A0A6L7IUT7_9ACTN|nr:MULTISPECIES: DegV family protein [Eggerthella]MBC5585290.1 DegV family protein [Eggerthella hominis]QOS69372.1 DegV family protein [Eggerthella guodeyinii]